MACQRSTKWTSHPDSRAAEILFLLNVAQLRDDGYYVDVDHGIPQAQLDGQDERDARSKGFDGSQKTGG